MVTNAALLAAAVSLVMAGGCSSDSTANLLDLSRTIDGSSLPLGQGNIRSWVRLGRGGSVTAIGVTFGEAALAGLPAVSKEYLLTLPAEAASTPFKEIAVNWQANGHPPPGIFDKPHFDFHFYMMDENGRNAVVPSNAATIQQAPAPELVPKDYVADPYFVPRSGVHYTDPTTPEFHGQPFTQDFIYGFAFAKMAFVEPMVTTAYLATKPQFSAALKLPQSYSPTGLYYPTSYAITYDGSKQEYTVSLEGMTIR